MKLTHGQYTHYKNLHNMTMDLIGMLVYLRVKHILRIHSLKNKFSVWLFIQNNTFVTYNISNLDTGPFFPFCLVSTRGSFTPFRAPFFKS